MRKEGLAAPLSNSDRFKMPYNFGSRLFNINEDGVAVEPQVGASLCVAIKRSVTIEQRIAVDIGLTERIGGHVGPT
jgi:hypothetical protein